MRIRRLRLINYRRHRDLEIEFPDGVIAIVGRNGSGKTSLLESIAFALYGTQATRTAKALLRHDQAAPGDAMRVELDAEVGGQALAVVRELRGSQQTGVASLTVDGQTIVAPQTGSFEAVTAEVSQRIGLDRDTFFTTVFAQQKDLARLGDKSKAERKKLVLGMLGIDALDRAIIEARTLRRTREARVQALEEQLARFEDAADAAEAASQAAKQAEADLAAAKKAWQAQQAALQKAEKEHAAWLVKAEAHRKAEVEASKAKQAIELAKQQETELRRRLAEAEAAGKQIAQHRPVADRLPALKQAYDGAVQQAANEARRKTVQGRIDALAAELDKLEVPAAPNGLVEQAQADVATAQKSHQEAREAIAVIGAQARGVKDRLRRLASHDACPVCERPLEGTDVRTHLEQELEDHEARAAKATADAQGAEQHVATAQVKLRDAEAARRTHEQAAAKQAELGRNLEHARKDLASLGPAAEAEPDAIKPELEAAEKAHAAVLRLEASAAQHGDLQQRLVAVKDELTAAAAQTSDAEAAMAKTGHDPAAMQQAQATLKAATDDERSAERAATTAQHALELAQAKLQQAQRRVEEASAAKAALKEAREDHRLYEALAGKRGLFDRFRSHLVGRIGPAVAAEASRLLSRFTNGRYTEVILDDDYELYVSDEGVRYHLDRFSGGESDLVHLALRLAVSRLLLERSGAEIRFLALDEVFGSLDDERRRLVLGALQELGTLYSQVFLVTHHEDMREMLDHTLLVEETPEGAEVRMHNA